MAWDAHTVSQPGRVSEAESVWSMATWTQGDFRVQVNTGRIMHLAPYLTVVWHGVCFLFPVVEVSWVAITPAGTAVSHTVARSAPKLCQQQQGSTCTVQGSATRKLDSCHVPRGWGELRIKFQAFTNASLGYSTQHRPLQLVLWNYSEKCLVFVQSCKKLSCCCSSLCNGKLTRM